jgi:alpha-beta hydrolase superfamily lysophospholipase
MNLLTRALGLVLAIVVPATAVVVLRQAGARAEGTPPAARSVYDRTDVDRVDYTGLPAPSAITARDGTRLAVRVYGSQSDTVVLAIHGSSGSGRYYHPLGRSLSGRGTATVYALDLRGHGESGGRRGDVDYIGQLEDDVADVLAAIRVERPRARIVLLGHSAGGGLVVRYVGGGRGPAVDGYVLLAPYLGPQAPTTRPDSGGWATVDLPKVFALMARAAQGDVSGQDEKVLRFNQPPGTGAPGQVLAYSFRMMVSYTPRWELGRDLAALRRPLLVLAGERDESFYPDRYAPTFAPHAKGRFVVLSGVTHLGLVVNARTAEEVASWLGGLP